MYVLRAIIITHVPLFTGMNQSPAVDQKAQFKKMFGPVATAVIADVDVSDEPAVARQGQPVLRSFKHTRTRARRNTLVPQLASLGCWSDDECFTDDPE